MRRKGRVDANQGPIVEALRVCGWYWVNLTSVGNGCCDGLAVKPGRVRMVEVKGDKGALTPDQVVFHSRCFHEVVILRSVEDALGLK